MTPLILIAGFLGAGKTTLLRTLLPRLVESGLRPHVILNDYENAHVDAATLEEYSDLVRPISGTCICCGSQEELMQEFLQAELTLESVMLLEANGTADTTEIIEILTADRRVSRFTLPVQVTVVDARHWQQRGWNDRLERIQASSAGYHLITRSEEVSPGRLQDVVESLQTIAPGSQTVQADELASIIAALRSQSGSLHPRRFAWKKEAQVGRGSENPSATSHDHHATHHFASLEIPVPQPMESARFRALLERLPQEVLRVKGIARLVGGEHPVYFERTNGADSVKFTPIRHGRGFDYVAVLIGSNLDDAALRARFRDILHR